MAAGITYDASTFAAAEELYNVKSGYRMAGGANLYVTDLSAQEKIPPLTPLYVVADNTYAGVKNAYVVRNARVQANFTANSTDKKINIEKGSFWKVGDNIAFDESNYGTIVAIVTTNANYDEVEFDAAIPCNFTKGDVLFPVKVTKGTGSTPVITAHEAVVYEAAEYNGTDDITSLNIVKGSGLVDPGDGKTLTVKFGGSDIVISNVDFETSEAYDTITITGIKYSVPLGTVLRWSTEESIDNPDTFVAERTANYLAYAPAKVEAGASVTLLGRAFEIVEDKLYIPVTDADKASLGDRFMFI
ncbi:MAG: hypothetical protein PHC31_12900 [Clostridia bacterium]|nr:hypothetical protein [Clostridia bacterium]